MVRLSNCPVCHQPDFAPFLTCKDYTVSHETFQLEQCQTCGFVLTNPQPDESQIAQYYQSNAYVSHNDKPRGMLDRVYHIARFFTLRWKYQLIQSHSLKEPESILDFGCGTGTFLQYCQQKDFAISGVEPSEIAREMATRNTNTTISAELDQVSGSFDIITLWHVLEHVTNLDQTLNTLKARLAENGTMFIAVPNLQSRDATTFGSYWAAYDVPRHLWHFSRSTMTRILESHALSVTKTIPMPLDAYYVSMLSEQYKRGKNGILTLCKGLSRGLQSNFAAKRSNEYSSLIYVVRHAA